MDLMNTARITTHSYRIEKFGTPLHLRRERFGKDGRLREPEHVGDVFARWLWRALERRGLTPVANTTPSLVIDNESLYTRDYVTVGAYLRVYDRPVAQEDHEMLDELAVEPDVWAVEFQRLEP